MTSWDAIELGLEQYLQLLRRDERVRKEFERSRSEFFREAAAAAVPGAELRHLEWFLLERPSGVLGAVPAHAWQAAWRAASPGAAYELGTSLLQSLPGAFEVTARVLGEGLWVRDLFTLGEHPVAEARASLATEVGDLLVGRLYPVDGGTYLLSPAVSVFRNPSLLAAVQADLAEMRAARRGVLRIQQLELEHLFHGEGARAHARGTRAQVRARARQELLALGLEPNEVEGLFGRVGQAARAADGQAVTEILNDLAFETGIDLSSARLVLIEVWDFERLTHAPVALPERPAETRDARSALEAFDRGRAHGKDLELLFRELERAFGVDESDEQHTPDEEEDQGAPDFPGVVGAMVEEFLWEIEREHGRERAHAWSLLRALGNYARDIGVFEELVSARLLDFSARWLLDESGLEQPSEVERLLEALTGFCQWCEERQDLPLWKGFGDTLAALRVSVPRHVRLRRCTASGTGAALRVVRVVSGKALVCDDEGNEQAIALTAVQAEHLSVGDFVRLTRTNGMPALGPGYPAELSALLH